MVKHVYVGTTIKGWKVFATIRWDGTRLLISGVVGPRANGDVSGSCGQIDLSEVVDQEPGVNVDKLAEVWNRWHLNDMRPGCEHQREWFTGEPLEIVTYRLTSETASAQRELKRTSVLALASGKAVKLSMANQRLLALPYETHAPAKRNAKRYEVSKKETKLAGWTYPKEHPKGLLCKPCETCGYKYGSEWKMEHVPANVIAWLETLPETDKLPEAWTR